MSALLLGFVLGVLSSIVATPLIWWAMHVLPRRVVVRTTAVALHPLLPLRLRRAPARDAQAIIDRLFTAWGIRDRDLYLSCWHPDGVRTQRRLGHEHDLQTLEAIGRRFDESCGRYSEIKVPWWTVENVAIGSDLDVFLNVAYQMTLVRQADGILLVEEGREQYRLSATDGRWAISSNFDIFSFDHSIPRVTK